MIPVFVITLSEAVERQRFMRGHLDELGIPFQFLDGVDARRLDRQELERYAPPARLNYYRPLRNGEVGCGASHIAALRLIDERAAAYACVLEDDAVISPALAPFLDESTLRALPAFDVLRLGTLPRIKKRLVWHHADVGGVSVMTVLRPHALSTGQIYSRAGVQKILSQMPFVQAPFDDALYRENHVTGLRMMETRPSIVTPQMELESSIGERLHPQDRSVRGWLVKEGWKRRREWRALINFIRAWGVANIAKLRMGYPP